MGVLLRPPIGSRMPTEEKSLTKDTRKPCFIRVLAWATLGNFCNFLGNLWATFLAIFGL